MNVAQCLKRMDPEARERVAKRLRYLFDNDIQVRHDKIAEETPVTVDTAIFLLGSNQYKIHIMDEIRIMIQDLSRYPMGYGLPEELKRLKETLLKQQAICNKLVDSVIWHKNNPKPEPIEPPTVCKGPQSADCPMNSQ